MVAAPIRISIDLHLRIATERDGEAGYNQHTAQVGTPLKVCAYADAVNPLTMVRRVIFMAVLL
jgi:hypothetical protein